MTINDPDETKNGFTREPINDIVFLVSDSLLTTSLFNRPFVF